MAPNLDINQNIVAHDDRWEKSKYKIQIVWRNVFALSILHILAFYTLYMWIIGDIARPTFFWYIFVGHLGSIGIQAGAHRLWCHRAYKAKWPLRVALMIMQTIALQNHIYEWCRDHRVHHKYSETDADPHNSKRGFFFAHMGWLLVRKHPNVKEKGKTIDLSDLEADPIVRFQKKYYHALVLLFWGILPSFVSTYYFNETIFTAICSNMFRYVYSLHVTWLVNSAAHLYGYRPYNKNIGPTESLVYLLMGEGYHNYHHTFPWDYSASEYGPKDVWNMGTLAIDFFAWMGWAYDLKKVDQKVINQRIMRTGKESEQLKSNWNTNIMFEYIYGFIIYFWLLILLEPFRQWFSP